METAETSGKTNISRNTAVVLMTPGAPRAGPSGTIHNTSAPTQPQVSFEPSASLDSEKLRSYVSDIVRSCIHVSLAMS